MLPNKILLIICGSIAAYKSLDLIRELKRHGAELEVVTTDSALNFVTPFSLSALSGKKVHSDLFSLNDEMEMGHIALARFADLILVAPASADFMAKVAHGLAADLATSLLLAADWQKQQITFAPAMNPHMWSNLATQHNLKTLQMRGAAIIEPESGEAACGEIGVGRLASITNIINQITINKPLRGKHCIVTAGGTKEKIDPVRFIGNYSSGKQGFAIANALQQAGAKVTLIYGTTNAPPPHTTHNIQALSASEMLACVEDALPADIVICAAAVADWQATNPTPQKIKKNGANNLTLELSPTPDILQYISNHPTKRPKLVIGFAAETENLLQNAKVKLKNKGCDIILANNVANGAIFGSDDTEITYIDAEQTTNWGALSKAELATRLTKHITEFFNS
jgi:phosphopantothenoylcysteine decarboxylase/phosphopantothenate--cysteine ligase